MCDLEEEESCFICEDHFRELKTILQTMPEYIVTTIIKYKGCAVCNKYVAMSKVMDEINILKKQGRKSRELRFKLEQKCNRLYEEAEQIVDDLMLTGKW